MRYGMLCIVAMIVMAGALQGAWAADLSPKDVYEMKQKAIQNQDLNAFYKCISRENLAAISQAKDPKGMLFMIKALKTPSEYTIIREEPGASRTVLYLQGKAPNATSNGKVEPGYGRAVFVKEGKDWKYHEESWQKNSWK